MADDTPGAAEAEEVYRAAEARFLAGQQFRQHTGPYEVVPLITDPQTLTVLADHSDVSVLLQVARNPAAPVEALVKLADRAVDLRSARLLAVLAGNPRVPAESLRHIRSRADFDIGRALAGNPSTPADVLEDMARRADYWSHVVPALIRHPASTGEVASLIARSSADSTVRARAATHPKAGADVFRHLASSSAFSERTAVAASERTPPELLIELADDRDPIVRKAVANNPRAPHEALERLAEDPDTEIRVAARSTPDEEDVRRLANSHQDSVRVKTAASTKTPPAILAKLAGDPEWKVRRAVAGNPRAPRDSLERLLNDPHKEVRDAAQGNRGAAGEALYRGRRKDPGGRKARAAAADPATDPEVLAAHATGADDRLRLVAAVNPVLPVDVQALFDLPDPFPPAEIHTGATLEPVLTAEQARRVQDRSPMGYWEGLWGSHAAEHRLADRRSPAGLSDTFGRVGERIRRASRPAPLEERPRQADLLLAYWLNTGDRDVTELVDAVFPLTEDEHTLFRNAAQRTDDGRFNALKAVHRARRDRTDERLMQKVKRLATMSSWDWDEHVEKQVRADAIATGEEILRAWDPSQYG